MKISNDAEHEAALARIEQIMSLPEGSDIPSKELATLTVAVEAYELERWPLPEPTEEESRLFRMEQERHPEELQEDTVRG